MIPYPKDEQNKEQEEPLFSLIKKRVFDPVKEKIIDSLKYYRYNYNVKDIITFGSLTYMISGYFFIKSIEYYFRKDRQNYGETK